RMFSIRGGLGRFGLITPLSNHFCTECNRLRVTSDGLLRTCLFADREYRLRGLLRHPALGVDAVRRVLELANRRKPLGVQLLRARTATAVADKAMVGIGG
ncbi:MAG: cyclic pyranopterin phosphate synthase MoaA, partial [Desulfovibrionaceae bacterium]|nr:cyclic pyranopterin phosphate synthase MoaA [Desulfovibrionaceae bacterium]